MTATKTRDILRKAVAGERLTVAEGVRLLEDADLLEIGAAAHEVRTRIHPEPRVTYIIDRNVNYSNVCDSYCKFCSFYAAPGAKGGYVLSRAALSRKIKETIALGGNQVLMQGGTHPEWDVEWYGDLIAFVKSHGIHVHALSSPEIHKIAEVSNLSVKDTIARLRDRGLDSIPGGGAEILTDFARDAISPQKCTTAQWLDVHVAAHELGMRTTATMMFGHKERYVDRIEHLERLREVQAKAVDEAGHENTGFTAFICWAFQPTHALRLMEAAGGTEYLRTLAVARLYLQSVRNFQSSWVTMGPKVGQMALWFGANDMGSTMIEENVVSSAGVAYSMSSPELCRLISAAGFEPGERNFFYEPLEARFLDAPDRVREVVGEDPTNLAMAPGDFAELDSEVTAR